MWIKLDQHRYQNVLNATGIMIEVTDQNEVGEQSATIILISSDRKNYIVLEVEPTVNIEDELDRHRKSIESLINGTLKIWDLSDTPGVPAAYPIAK